MSEKRCPTCHFLPCRCEDLASGLAFTGVEACRKNKPSASQALKINARNIPNAVKEAKAAGVPTDFTKNGRPIFESRSHKKRYLKAFGYVNHDGGYGD